MNLEDKIKDVISKKLEDGTVEKVVEEKFKEGLNRAVEGIFSNHGDVTSIIRDKIKEVMVPYIESYDYSEYIVKLDTVLIEILKNTTIDNVQIMKNFQELMVPCESKEIDITDVFEKWCEYVEKNVSTTDLEVMTDDDVYYESVEVTFEVTEIDHPSWCREKEYSVAFECEQDEEMNQQLRLHKYDWEEGLTIRHMDGSLDVRSLRHKNTFEVFLLSLERNGVLINVDKSNGSVDVYPSEQPEGYYA